MAANLARPDGAGGVSDRVPLPTWLEESPRTTGGPELWPDRVETLVELIGLCWTEGGRNRVSVSVEGPWGSGKTSLAHAALDRLATPTDLEHRPLEVRFSARYSTPRGFTPWEALAYRIGEAIYRRLHKRVLARGASDPALDVPHPDGDGRIRVDTQVLLDKRLPWTEVAWRLAEGVGNKEWHPSLALFCDTRWKVTRRRRSTTDLLTAGSATVRGAVAAGTANAKGAVRAASDLASLLVGDDGVIATQGIDTRAFVERVNELIPMLGTRSERWRLLIVIDDLTRLAEAQLPSILDALGHLHALEQTVLLLNLDATALRKLHAVAPRASDGEGGEDYLTKLVDVRFPMPPFEINHARALVAEWWTSLDLPAGGLTRAGQRPSPSQLLLQRGLKTPRCVKRALRWIWMRLAVEERRTELDANQSVLVFRLLLDVFCLVEDRHATDELIATVEREPEALLLLATPPWGGDWRHPKLSALIDRQPAGRELGECMRLFELCQFYARSAVDRQRERGQRAWRRYERAHARHGIPRAISANAPDLRRTLLKLVDKDSRDVFVNALGIVDLASQARGYGFVNAPPEQGDVRDRWFDADWLFSRPVDDVPAWLMWTAFHEAGEPIRPRPAMYEEATGKAVRVIHTVRCAVLPQPDGTGP